VGAFGPRATACTAITGKDGASPLRGERRVLMMAVHFPPSNVSTGWQRPLKFAKYLLENGWQSTVLTVPPACYERVDFALLDLIPPEVPIHRAYARNSKHLFSFRGRYPGFVEIPDRYLSWIPFALPRALKVIRREPVNALFSTSPPPTSHLLGYVVARLTRLPWIADFRDPWIVSEDLTSRPRSMRSLVERALERAVVRRATRVTVTTPELGTMLTRRYGEAAAAKIVTIYNGYDDDDLSSTSPELAPQLARKVVLVHAGLLDLEYRNPEPIIAAVRRCLDRGTLDPNEIQVRFLGGAGGGLGGRLRARVETEGLSAVIRIEDPVPFRAALTVVLEAPALLVIQGGPVRVQIPAKAFDYLRTGKPILGITPADSATAGLLKTFSGTYVASPDDAAAVDGALTALVEAWRTGQQTWDRRKDGIERYSRRSAAAQLACVLDDITGAPACAAESNRA